MIKICLIDQKRRSVKVKITIHIWVLLFIFSNSINSSTYYKAPEFWENPYWGEPGLDKDRLSNFTVKIKSGSTEKGLNCGGAETNVLNICGPTKLRNLTKGVPSSVLNKYSDSPINNVWSVSNLSKEFGDITFSSKFRVTNLNFYLTQNLSCGFFGGGIFQIENISFSDISFKDSTRTTDLPTTITKTEWQLFTNKLFTNLEKYGIKMPTTVNKKGLSRVDIFGGWTKSFTNTESLDFVDFTSTIGLSFPVGTDKSSVFNLHRNLGRSMSAIVSAKAAIGVWDWLTIGVFIGTELYKSYNRVVPMKTDSEQCGLIKLAKGVAKVDKKPMINFGFFAKAEHFHKRFSIIFAYQCTLQKKTYLNPIDIFTFDSNIVNNDCTLCKWKMHTINFSIDYEFATEETPTLPKIGIFFDLPMDGKGILKTKQSGVGLSIKTEW
jgi:hypothetical protein